MKPKPFARRRQLRTEEGQAMLFTVLALAIFLIGAMAFAIDMSNVWFNRQSAQTAADAACTAGAMDLLVQATNGTMPGTAGFTSGTQFSCDSTGSPNAAPCKYAALNGFNSNLTQGQAASGIVGNNVLVSFPDPKNYPNFKFPGNVATSVLMQVSISNNVPTWFASMLGNPNSLKGVGANALCGVIQASSPIPILVLNPTVASSLSLGGGGGTKQTGNIQIIGGPSKSVQVNSVNAGAAGFKGGPTVNLCQGGGGYCGSAMGVWGGPSATPSNFVTSCGTNALCKTGQQVPQWNVPSPPIADPYASTPAPQQPTSQPDAGNWGGVKHPPLVPQNTNGCPDPSGCYEYPPGYYPNGICVGKGNCSYKATSTAIFDPGVYYLKSQTCNNGNGSFCVESQSCVRPSSADGDGSGGTVFYFADTGGYSVFVGANAGGQGCTGITSFDPTVQVGTGQLQFGAACDATSLKGLKDLVTNGVMATPFTGSVLLAPCRKPPTGSTLCQSAADANGNTNCDYNFGDPLGTNNPIGEQRGILFFQNRTVNATNNPSWGGGGSMLLAGSMYFHQCANGGTDAAGLTCDNALFNDIFNLGGSSGSSTYVLGDIIVDQLSLQGNTAITMNLNPTASFTTLKAALLQ